jgi:hypothetical protein
MVVTGDVGWINADNNGQPVQELLTPIPGASLWPVNGNVSARRLADL